MIPVTQPFLPPQEEYQELLTGIWERQWLTNMGPLSKELEEKLSTYLDQQHLLFVTNGTVALQMAIRALDLSGDIITTPFSFVATTSSIVWEGCRPVFVDIDPQTLNIDASKIEAAITPRTSAILATHVYGNPCDVLAIEAIARKHKLKVIYDAAHAFGVQVYGKSIFSYGDVSCCSLHATKLYHSIEGGLVISQDADLHRKLEYMRNFGFNGPEHFAELGINGKNSEFHAAMGIVNLRYLDFIHQKRKQIAGWYDDYLQDLPLNRPQWHSGSCDNYAYYPVLFESEAVLLQCKQQMEAQQVLTRRYFYPSLTHSLPYVSPVNLPVTDDVAKRVLCLPIYVNLSREQVLRIVDLLHQNLQIA